jgi:hypothetical protein
MVSGARARGDKTEEFPLPEDAQYLGTIDPLRYLLAVCMRLGLNPDKISVSGLDLDRPFDSAYQSSKAKALERLRELRRAFVELSVDHPVGGRVVGQGSIQAGQVLPLVERTLSAAIAAVESGVDENQTPISKANVASGLLRLCAHVRAPAVSTLLGLAVLNEEGIGKFNRYLGELTSIAEELESMTPEYAR